MSFPNQLLECLMIKVAELKNIQEDSEHYFGYSRENSTPERGHHRHAGEESSFMLAPTVANVYFYLIGPHLIERVLPINLFGISQN